MPLPTLAAAFPWAAPLGAPGAVVTVTVGGSVVVLMPGSLSITDSVGQRSMATFTVQDYQGLAQYKVGQPVAIYDLSMTLIYAGVVVGSKRTVASGISSMLLHDLTCSDWHYLADKRVAAASYAYRTCGFMARNLVDGYLAAEGVTYGRGINLLSAQQSDVEAPVGAEFTQHGSGLVALARDTTPGVAKHGAGALRVSTDGTVTNQGFEARVPNNGSNFPYGGSIVCSVWLKAAVGTPTVELLVWSSSGTQGTPVNCVLSTSWQLFTICAQIPFPASQTYYALTVCTTAALGLTFWADQLQMELAFATPWAPGGGISQNLLTAEQADVESSSLTGFAVHGAGGVTTMVQDTTTAWSNAASLKVTTDGTFAFQGVDLTGVANTGQFPIGTIITFSYWAKSTTAMTLYIASPGVGQSVAITAPQGATWARNQFSVQVTSAAPNPVLFQILTPTAQAGTFWLDGIQLEIGSAPTAWELGGTAQTVQDGPEVVSQVVNYKQVATALDDLATLAGFTWLIDQYKVLHFQAASAYLAPWTLDGTQALDGSLVLEDTNPLYRNSQWMLGATGTTQAQTETQKGDGSKRVFLTSYAIHAAPSSITVNGGATQTVGVLGVDTGKQWYWAKGKPGLTQDASGAVLAATDVLSITYVGEYIVVTNSIDGNQQSLELALEGAGTGLVEQVTADASLVTLGQAFQSGAALLSKFAVFATTLTFRTRTPGLAPGQLFTVNLPPVWQFSGQQVLIESLTITYDDFQLWYDVKALVGPVDATWVQFWQNVASKQFIVDTTIGNGSTTTTVALAQTETAAWNWTASYSALVTTCPVFPLTFPATLC